MPASGRWSDLRLRVLSAAVLVPLALVCVWIGGWPFDLLMTAAALGLAVEWTSAARRGTAQRGTAQREESEASLPHTGGGGRVSRPAFLAGFLYILLAAACLAWLRGQPLVGRANLIVLLLLVWASDIGAYAVGRTIGGPRLAPRISPGKTISGAIGGLAAAVLVGVLAALALSPSADLPRAALTAGGLGLAAQAGDLLESWVKRRLGVKDSGTLIPGHGGLFDRLDALLAAAPVAVLLALLAGGGLAWWQ